MPTGSEIVCLSGETGSDRRTVRMTRFTPTGHRAPPANEIDDVTPRDQIGLWPDCRHWRGFARIAAIVPAAVLRNISPNIASCGKRRIRASRDDEATPVVTS